MFVSGYKWVRLLIAVLLLVCHTAKGQEYQTENSYLTQQLALVYLKIDFTEAQRQTLSGLELEFIFRLDSLGYPTLEDVNGLHDAIILDSMKRAGPLPRINSPEPDLSTNYYLYFLKLQYPVYRKNIAFWGSSGITYRRLTLNDFEFVNLSGRRLDINVGGQSNLFAGKPGRYLGLGGGAYVEIGYTGGRKWGGSIALRFYGNNLKKPFPINTDRKQSSAPMSMLAAYSLHLLVEEKEKSFWLLRAEIAPAFMNVSPKENEDDKENVQFSGWSPGVVATYHRRISRMKPGTYYLEPVLRANYLVLHAGAHYNFMDHPMASGFMLEAGAGFGFSMHDIKEYRLK